MTDAPLFFLIAGEASGDFLGAQLMKSLKKLTGGKARFAGIGGERMQAEGLETFFSQAELAHVGLAEILLHLPRLLRRIRQTAEEVKKRKPMALITIDSPDFNFRVARRLKDEAPALPLIHYVAPSVWAWRPGRAHKVAQFLDHLLALLPFEPPYFGREGLSCTFVGHPVVEGGAGRGDAARFRARYNLQPEAPLLAVLPGSRASEIKRLMPVFRETVEKLKEKHPDLQFVIPTVGNVAGAVKKAAAEWPVPVIVTLGDEDKYDAFAAATAALACSGTVSVELAMARLPAVIAYKVHPVTGFLMRRLLKTKYATLINIMRNRVVVPEFLQENCAAEKLAVAVYELLNDAGTRQCQIDELGKIAEWLGQGQFVPSERAAQAVLDAVRQKTLEARPVKRTVLQVIPNLGAGGAEQSCVDIVSGLTERGCLPLVVSAGGSRASEAERRGGRHYTYPVNSKNPFVILKNAWRLARFIRNKHVDIVHVRSRAPAWSAWLAARMTGRPFVTTFHAAYKFSGAAKKFYNRVMTRGDRVIAISQFIADHIVRSYRINPKKIRVIPRGVELDKFMPENVTEDRRGELRGEWKLAGQPRIVLMPARISPIKGHRLLIEAMAMLPLDFSDAVAVVIGDDQGREGYCRELEGRIRSNGLQNNVKLVGHCTDMPAAYSLADVVVVPALVPEGFGRVPVEAMAMGVPVIASDLGATRETVVEGETGWLMPPSNPQAWADAIVRALTMTPEERARMAQAGMERARAYYGRALMIRDTLAVYDELMGED
ncbi:MAG: lipid-A-disaccharide synthase [Alphaproteobacteria bacterium]|nr:lipid-A-disaccharide synthase [Alphaproteobacteria bacterium]